MEYGTGGVRKLYVDYAEGGAPSSVCNGGSLDGQDCSGNVQACTDGGGKCEFITSEIQRVGWFGYCIQRDGSMTILADPDKNACLLWLPVDQLFGSTDLNNKFTTAGFPITNTAYCTDTELYVNLFTTGVDSPGPEATMITPACAESYRGTMTPNSVAGAGFFIGDPLITLFSAIASLDDVNDYGASNEPDNEPYSGNHDPMSAGDSCDTGDWDNCWTSVSCPKNFFAVIGGCDNSENTCVQGAADAGADDDCPYFCVPSGSWRTADSGSFDVDTECTPPNGLPVPINSCYGFGSSATDCSYESTWDGSFSDYPEGAPRGYLVADVSDYVDRYKTCALQGVPFEPYEDGDTAADLSANNWYLPLNPTVGGFIYNYPSNNANYYLGCAEVAFASVEAGYGNSSGQVGNAAFTNRAISPNLSAQYTTENAELVYRTSTQPYPVGRVVQALGFVDGYGLEQTNVLQRRLETPTFIDQAPVIVEACLLADQLSVHSDVVTLSSCSVYPADTQNLARGYQQLSVSLPGAAVAQEDSCTPGDVCAGGEPGGATCNNGDGGGPNPPSDQSNYACFIGCGPFQLANNPTAAGFDSDGNWDISEGTAFCQSLGLQNCIDSSGIADGSFCNAEEAGEGCDASRIDYVCSRFYGHASSDNPSAADFGTYGSPNTSAPTGVCAAAISEEDIPGMSYACTGSCNYSDFAKRTFQCNGPDSNDAICYDSSDCPGGSETVYCSSAGVCSVTIGAAGDSIPTLLEEGDREAGLSLLQQFFAEFRGFWQFETPERTDTMAEGGDTGYYQHVSSNSNDGLPQGVGILPEVTSSLIDPDIREDGDSYGFGANDGEPTAPVVRAVGEICNDSACIEGVQNSVSVNGKTGTIFTSEGNFRTDLRFFATTDPNQFPLRQVLVDWGDGTDADDATSWGRGSLSGSTAPDNYYRAHRGLKADQTPWCTDGEGAAWGLTSNSCETAPFQFQHHYRCTPLMQEFVEGRTCVQDADGRLNSPCSFGDGLCTFQPRVFVQDNWGYCTGTCDDPASTTDDPQCFANETVDECNYIDLPTSDLTIDGAPYSDPWVYYDGWISVEP